MDFKFYQHFCRFPPPLYSQAPKKGKGKSKGTSKCWAEWTIADGCDDGQPVDTPTTG